MAYQAKWDKMLEDCKSHSITLGATNIPDYQDAFVGRTSGELQEAYMALDGSARDKLVFIATRVLDTQTMMGVLKNTCFYAEAIYDIEAQAKALAAFQVTQAQEKVKVAEAQVKVLNERLASLGASAARLGDDLRTWNNSYNALAEKHQTLLDALRTVGFNPQV